MADEPISWPDKHEGEKHLKGGSWKLNMSGATITAVDAEVMEGDVVIDTPVPTYFAADVQSIWITGGTAEEGFQRVRLKATFSDGRDEFQDFVFVVTE